jgi:hypothetical protein
MLAAALLGLCPALAAAQEGMTVGESDFVHLSDLALDGFEPFGTSGATGDLFGMRKGSDMYLCYGADRAELQAKRQSVLGQELAGARPDRRLPNILVFCVLTQ